MPAQPVSRKVRTAVPWLSEPTQNLLALYSLEAYWSESFNGIPGWRVRPLKYPAGQGFFVREGAPLDEWLAVISRVKANWEIP